MRQCYMLLFLVMMNLTVEEEKKKILMYMQIFQGKEQLMSVHFSCDTPCTLMMSVKVTLHCKKLASQP